MKPIPNRPRRIAGQIAHAIGGLTVLETVWLGVASGLVLAVVLGHGWSAGLLMIAGIVLSSLLCLAGERLRPTVGGVLVQITLLLAVLLGWAIW